MNIFEYLFILLFLVALAHYLFFWTVTGLMMIAAGISLYIGYWIGTISTAWSYEHA